MTATSSGLHHDHDHDYDHDHDRRHCRSCLHQQLASNYLTAWHTTADLPRMGNGEGKRKKQQHTGQ